VAQGGTSALKAGVSPVTHKAPPCTVLVPWRVPEAEVCTKSMEGWSFVSLKDSHAGDYRGANHQTGESCFLCLSKFL
jgi:hypothetical protein